MPVSVHLLSPFSFASLLSLPYRVVLRNLPPFFPQAILTPAAIHLSFSFSFFSRLSLPCRVLCSVICPLFPYHPSIARSPSCSFLLLTFTVVYWARGFWVVVFSRAVLIVPVILLLMSLHASMLSPATRNKKACTHLLTHLFPDITLCG